RSSFERDFRGAIEAGRLTLMSPYDPDSRFTVWNAMDRNKDVYALSDCGIVVSSDFDKGGTWAGAVENLGADWVPLFVRRVRAAGEAEQLQPGAHLLQLEGDALQVLQRAVADSLQPLDVPDPDAHALVARVRLRDAAGGEPLERLARGGEVELLGAQQRVD